MRRSWLGVLVGALALAAGLMLVHAQPSSQPRSDTVMSFHNRLLLNRLAVSGYRTVQVMLAIAPGRFEFARDQVARVGGQVKRAEPEIDYLRVELPIERLLEIVYDKAIEAYQIASLSTASWYVDANPQAYVEAGRKAEVRSLVSREPRPPSPLAPLSPEMALASGYTADDEVGVGRWRTEHPTFDGRSVTIAFLETGLVEFGHPALQTAKTLDGLEVPKITGILNTLGPDDPDDTRVALNVEIRAERTWYRVAGRTYILPKPGAYLFGIYSLPVASGLVQPFAILRDEVTGDTRVDTDGDADFRAEAPIADANTRIDVRHLHLLYPRPADVAFVLASGPRRDQVHLYLALSGHHTMAVSVATANPTTDGLAGGVAPGARALVVRYFASESRFRTVLEGYLDTIRRPDVDILCDSTGITTVPDTANAFAAVFFDRLVARYRKPIFHSAGNVPRLLAGASGAGGVLSVGGSMGPATFASLYGGGTLPRTIVHPWSAAGPSLDGALKPDFLAPENRLSAGVWIDDGYVPLPKNAPTAYLPPGYEVSCCTSASSPYAAGVAALLLSAARQSDVAYSANALGRALRASAQFLPDWPAHQQGNGQLDVNAAWLELQRAIVVPKIRVTGNIVHALGPYAGLSSDGVGLFEQSGWRAGDRGQRTLRLRRESGEAGPQIFRLSWTGNDGTFTAPPTVTLPLDTTVAVPVDISVGAPGAHSAIVNLHDPVTGAVVFRTQTTIVAPTPVDPRTDTIRFAGSVALMRTDEHFAAMPSGVTAMGVELEVTQGSVTATLLPPHGLYRSGFGHIQPLLGRTLTKGRYSFLWPQPAPGTWSVSVSNTSASQEADASLVSTDNATYTLTLRPVAATLALRSSGTTGLAVDIRNPLGAIAQPELQISRGTQSSVEATTLTTGLPSLFDIQVPDAASMLQVQVRAKSVEDSALELYLYDCTSGECFAWDFTLPAAREQKLVVRSPKAGRWVAAVNSAPFPTKPGRFTLEHIVTRGASRRQAISPHSMTAAWSERLDLARLEPIPADGRQVLVCELIDAGAERDALSRPWDNRAGVPDLASRPVAMATTVWRPH